MAAAWIVFPKVALAHTGLPVDAPWWRLWSPDPLIVANLVALSVLYAIGFSRLRAVGNRDSAAGGLHAGAFWLAIFALAVALLSPIEVLAHELLWVHMVQHMILMNVAAPLFVIGSPVRVMLWVFPPEDRRLVGRSKRTLHRRGLPRYLLWQPVTLFLLYAAVLWIWHLPVLYEAALRVPLVHDMQHLMFFAVSCVFWRVLFDPIGRLRLARTTAVLYLFLTSLHATILGVFMALAPRLWYPTYARRTAAWGFDALEDQQLAGYIMWMPACAAYALVAAVVFAKWLREEPPESATPRVP
jgi:cytochrome c oxidase assembly factor CtaG